MKYGGILEGYPNIRERFGHVADYLSLLRPFTLLPPFLVGVFGSLIAIACGLSATGSQIIYVALTLVLCQAVGQCINQAVGSGEDLINKPYRPIPSGRLGVKEAYGFGLLLMMIAIGRAFTINLSYGGGILIILFFAISYNLALIEARKRLGINLLWMALSRGLLVFPVIWSAYGDPFVLKPWLLGSIGFLWVLALQSTKDLGDIPGDTFVGNLTLPVVYGASATKVFMRLLSILPLIILAAYLWLGLLPSAYALLLGGLVLFRHIAVRNFDVKLDFGENNLSWLVFYIGLGMIYLLSFIAELI